MSDSIIKERHSGVDALRILAMLMICTLHVLGQGGVLGACPPGTPQYRLSWLLECTAYCGVNCYALISGYVSVKAEFKWSRLALIWLQVVVYELLFSLYFQLFVPSVMLPEFWRRAITPFTSDEYWYITAYVGLFVFIPIINSAFAALSKRRMTAIVVFLFVVFILIRTFNRTTGFGLSRGYSSIWLMVLYVFGGYVRCYVPHIGKRKLWFLPLFFISVAITWLSYLYISDRFVDYISVTVFLAAMSLFLFFVNTDFKSIPARKVIFFIAPTTFGVYIIHTQPLVFNIFLKDAFSFLSACPAGLMLLYAGLCSCAMFIVCSLVEKIRIKIFDILRIRKLAQRLDALISDK